MLFSSQLPNHFRHGKSTFQRFRHRSIDALGRLFVAALIAIALATPAFLLVRPDWHQSTVQCVLALVYFVGVLLAVIYAIERSARGARFSQLLLDRLDYLVHPDRHYFTPRVTLKPTRRQCMFELELIGIPRNCRELMIVAQQIGHPARPYDISSLKTQIKNLSERLEKRKQTTRISWVCFTTRNGTFVAYQPFHVFLEEVLVKGLNACIDILNEYDVEKFSQDIEGWGTARLNSILVFRALPDMFFLQAPEGLTNRQVLSKLLEEPAGHLMPPGHLMLVTPDKKPAGVVTLACLAEELFRGTLGGDTDHDIIWEPWRQQSEDAGQEQEDDFTDTHNADVEHDRATMKAASDALRTELPAMIDPDAGGEAVSR